MLYLRAGLFKDKLLAATDAAEPRAEMQSHALSAMWAPSDSGKGRNSHTYTSGTGETAGAVDALLSLQIG